MYIYSSFDETENHLRKLYKVLNYEISAPVLFILIFLPGAGIILNIAILLFTPFMLYVLYKASKRGWMIAFIVLIFLPLISARFYIEAPQVKMIVSLAVVMLFFLYCFLLRHSIGSQLNDLDGARRFEIMNRIKKGSE